MLVGGCRYLSASYLKRLTHGPCLSPLGCVGPCRYADWAKRRHFNGPVMAGLRKQTTSLDDQQQQQPPVVSASTAWRAHPPTAAVRAARGVEGRYTPAGSSSSSTAVDWEEPSLDEVEAEFWRIVEVAEEQVEALYGQDIDTATYCSAFPTIRVSVWKDWLMAVSFIGDVY